MATFMPLFIAALFSILCLAGAAAPPKEAGELLWPLPRPQLSFGKDTFTLRPDMVTLVPRGFSNCSILEEAVLRFTQAVNMSLAVRDPDLHLLYDLVLDLEDNSTCRAPRTFGDDDSYKLIVNSSGFYLKGKTVWGILNGLETLSQLVYVDHSTLQYRIHETHISDQPKWHYRGTAIDTSAHYIAVDVIKQHLDAMAMNKLNVLHWTMVGNDSWPLEIKDFPRLTRKGAFSPFHVYSREQVRDVVSHATARGIMVIPDLNLPKSVASIAKGYPDFTVQCNGTTLVLHPFAAVDFLSRLFADMKSLFGSSSIHLGALLPYSSCTKDNQPILEAMRINSIPDLQTLDRYFVAKVLNLVMDAGFENFMIWDKYVQFHVRVTPALVQKISLGNPTPPTVEGSSAQWVFHPLYDGQLWVENYGKEHMNLPNKTKNQHLLGAEAAMNGHHVDGTNLFVALWPPSAHVAENLWTFPAVQEDSARSRERLLAQRCRMIRRDIPVPPIEDHDAYCEEEWRANPPPGVDLEAWQEWYRPETTPAPTTTLAPRPPYLPPRQPSAVPSQRPSLSSGHFPSIVLIVLACGLLLFCKLLH